MFKLKKKKRKLITDENELYIYLRDCMLAIYSNEFPQEDILYAWGIGCDSMDEAFKDCREIIKTLEELK